MAIKIRGVIGADINGQVLAEQISRLSGDITFEIDSPGGSVFHGISIYNAIKNYDRGKCKMHVVGDCSSMALYVAMAGDGDIEFEPNSIAVAHNPWSIAIGDYIALQKEAKILEEMASIYAEAFVKKGLFTKAEIQKMMNEETWFMGENLKQLGVILGEEKEEDKNTSNEIKIAACRERLEEAKAKIKALKLDGDVDKIAALISKDFKGQTQTEEQGKNSEIEQKEKGEKEMTVKDLNDLKTQNASVYQEAKGEGAKEEQKRVASLMKFVDIDQQAVIKAIEDGVDVNDNEFQAAILQARVSKTEIKGMQKENPDDVDPQAETHAPEGGEGGEPTEEQKAQAKKEADDKKFNAILNAMGIEQEK